MSPFDIIDWRRVKPPDQLRSGTRGLLLPLLVPLSGIYGVVTWVWRAVPVAVTDVGIPVVSVGSLAVGGTGKTPVCMQVAKRFRDLGHRPCILSRGYRRKSTVSPLVVSDGRDILAGMEESGDEPYMMARRLEGVGVVVGKDRLGSAVLAMDKLGSDLLVLDDGFQVRNLARSADILCFDEDTLRGGNALLPWGTLREGWSAMQPGHIAVVRLEHRDSRPSARDLAHLREAAVFYSVRSKPSLVDADLIPIDHGRIVDARFALVSGIARPAAFERSCLDTGATIGVSIRFDDHHWYTEGDIRAIRAAMERTGCNRIFTTEKDIWKLPAGLKEICLILTADLDFLNREGFWRMLDSKLVGKT